VEPRSGVLCRENEECGSWGDNVIDETDRLGLAERNERNQKMAAG
jgi:hypothetical protein